MGDEMGNGGSEIASCSQEGKLKQENSAFDNLADELFVEILHRLPLKSAHVCKCVSRRWCSLISSPYFARCHVRRMTISLPSQAPASALICQCLGQERDGHSGIHFLFDSQLKSLNFSLSDLRLPASGTTRILGSSGGLILCSSKSYIVCNPLTRQWLTLPPPPQSREPLLTGFVCDPCFDMDNCTCYFKAVRVFPHKIPNVLNVEIYRSENNQWSELEVPFPGDINFAHSWAVACNNILHWVSRDGGVIVAYDPNYGPQNDGHFRLIPLPQDPTPRSDLCFGACQGHLRYVQLQANHTLRIWELEDYHAGEWCLKHEVTIGQVVSENCVLRLYLRGASPFMPPLAVHPLDPNVVYLSAETRIISYNIRLRRAEVVYYFCGNDDTGFPSRRIAFPYVFPWWPTPLPTFHHPKD